MGVLDYDTVHYSRQAVPNSSEVYAASSWIMALCTVHFGLAGLNCHHPGGYNCFGVTEFTDFIHHLTFWKNILWKLNLFPSSGKQTKRHLLVWACYKEPIRNTGPVSKVNRLNSFVSVAITSSVLQFRVLEMTFKQLWCSIKLEFFLYLFSYLQCHEYKSQ